MSDRVTDDAAVEWPLWLRPLIKGLRDGEGPAFLVPPADAAEGMREAAVLVLFGEGPAGPDVLLMQRSAELRNHPGQPAFPGGGIDPGDDGPVGAALREAAEETGLDPAGVEVITTLPELWIPPSGNVVTPVIAWWRVPSAVHAAEPAEVSTVARVPIADLVDPANRLLVRTRSGVAAPGFRVADMLVWGFTAGVLDWLLTLAGWAREWDRSVVEVPPGLIR